MTPKFLPAFALMLLAGLMPTGASAQSVRVDDTGTTVSEPLATMRWRQFVPGRVADNTVEGSVGVDLRLDVTGLLGRAGRLYMTMSPARETLVRARWTTQGRLLPGAMSSGERTLVYEGRIGPELATESLLMSFEADGASYAQPFRIQFSFEFEPR